MPFQDSVVTNEKFVRLNMVGVDRKMYHIFCDMYGVQLAAESSSLTGDFFNLGTVWGVKGQIRI